jgi:Protein of unknown function (DUF3300)
MGKIRVLAILCAVLLVAPPPYSFAQQPQQQPIQQPASTGVLSPQQLDSLVAPLALYPDPILSQVLVASTYPLQIVEAERWLEQHSSLTGKPLADAAAKHPWDASVQALVMIPDVLKRLSQNISWTSNLGNAVLAQEDGVMQAIQRMRQKAQQNGALQSTPQQTVATTTSNGQSYITIEPASPEVVYVPQYNPEAVWGPSAYPYPSMYYPPGLGLVSWGTGFALGAIWGGSWNNWGWNAGWGSNNIFVNNNFINRNNFNRASIANGNRWVHNSGLRGSLGYNNPRVAHRFQGARGNIGQRPTVGQIQQRLGQGNFGRGNFGQGSASRIAQGNAGNRVGQGHRGFTPNGPGRQFGQGGANRFGNRNFGGANRSFSGHRGGFANRGGFHGGGFRGGGGFHGGGGFRGGGGSRGGGGFRGGGGGRRGGGRRR